MSKSPSNLEKEMTMRKLIIFATISVVAPQVSADEEYMEVAAPNECCQTPMPGTLGLIASMAGAPSASIAAGGLKAAATKYALERAAKQREARQKSKEKAEQQSQYDDATTQGKGDTVAKELGATARQALDSGSSFYMKYKRYDPETKNVIEELEIKDCQPSGILNPKTPCTQQKYEIFFDPNDGVEKWALTLAIVEPAYNPRHYEADKSGFYPKVVDGQSFTIVFESIADLEYQIRQISGG